jgi:acetylornithine deacetylase/succinyl-diaminopimelate desuccinylase-like protein
MASEQNAHLASSDIEFVRASIRARWNQILDDLVAHARIPSVSWPSFEQTHVAQSAEQVAERFRALKFFPEVLTVREPTDDGELGQPAIIARRPARNGAATVLLYAHHDVQPPGDESVWLSAPFEPEVRGDRMFGRGVADDKAGVTMHVESLRSLLENHPDTDLGVVLFIEGEEEYGSPSFTNTLATHRDLLEADVIIVADSGNWTTEIPAVTVSLRGNATVKVTVRTLDHALHSGMFGGAVPDAMLAMTRLLASLHTENGDVAVRGLHERVAETPEYSLERLRNESGLLDGVRAIGDDHLARLWNKPAITVIGLDMPSTAQSSNTLIPAVSAMVSLRVAPGQAAGDAATALVRHLEQHVPFGAHLTVEVLGTGSAFSMVPDSPSVSLMKNALAAAYGADVVDMGVGGSIPFIAEFVEVFPDASVLVTGVEDPDSRAHSPNESLHLPSFENAIVAQSIFLAELARQTAR